ncbi:MAG: MFS transporter [Syntrophobacteraceae bacterium]|nr:MFS transporter [Syntrophobacteraceae bacterium]
MNAKNPSGLQWVVFSLVCAAFTTVYITQPVLPVIRWEFHVNETRASWTIAAVILGIAISNLPFGMLSDRYPLRPIILTGGGMVAACGFLCSMTSNLSVLIGARFVQGLFLPSLTTCLAAHLARSLPAESLNVVMGTYVSATVAGGLMGRLLGGWIHPPLHWRFAFVSASFMLLGATFAAVRRLPRSDLVSLPESTVVGFVQLLSKKQFLRIYFVAFGAFFAFSSLFNYLPFYLSGPPFGAKTEVITLLYLSYVVGIVISPLAGKISNRIGNGGTMIVGAVVFGLSIALTLIPSLIFIILSLLGTCVGFFAIHASAAGSLNKKLTGGQGRANALYVLFYYLGGAVGITLSGHVYSRSGWHGVAALTCSMLLFPLATGAAEKIEASRVGPSFDGTMGRQGFASGRSRHGQER